MGGYGSRHVRCEYVHLERSSITLCDDGHGGMACFGGCSSVDWVRAKLMALSQVHIRRSSLIAFMAANSCVMVLDDRSSTARRLAWISVGSGGGVGQCGGAIY